MAWSSAAEGERWWWLGTLAIIRVPAEAVEGRYSLTESLLPHHASPPRHSHPQDETFIVLEGEVTMVCGEDRVLLGPGGVGVAPGGVAHTFRVESQTARAYILSTPAGIEELPRALGVKADSPTLPPPDTQRPPAEEIARRFAEHSLIIHGPPLGPGD